MDGTQVNGLDATGAYQMADASVDGYGQYVEGAKSDGRGVWRCQKTMISWPVSQILLRHLVSE